MNTFLELLNYMETTGHLPLPRNGLCYAIVRYELKKNPIFQMFMPSDKEKEELTKEGKNSTYWASDSIRNYDSKATNLRKTIIAFCAAINNEL